MESKATAHKSHKDNKMYRQDRFSYRSTDFNADHVTPNFPFNQDNIHEIRYMQSLIQSYPNERLIPQFEQLSRQYPSYRAVRGDGNCFYRAFAFMYLRDRDLSRFGRVFNENVTNVCSGHSLEFQNRNTFEKELYNLYKEHIEPLNLYGKVQREQKLRRLFNTNILFDKLLIMYFRSINYLFVKNSSEELKGLFEGYQIQKIKCFLEETETPELYSMGLIFKTKIKVMAVDESRIQELVYHEEFEDRQMVFSYRPGHYEILYHHGSQYLRGSRQSDFCSRRNQQIESGNESLRTLRTAGTRTFDEPWKRSTINQHSESNLSVNRSKLSASSKSPLLGLNSVRTPHSGKSLIQEPPMIPQKSASKRIQPQNHSRSQVKHKAEDWGETKGHTLTSQRIKEYAYVTMMIAGVTLLAVYL